MRFLTKIYILKLKAIVRYALHHLHTYYSFFLSTYLIKSPNEHFEPVVEVL